MKREILLLGLSLLPAAATDEAAFGLYNRGGWDIVGRIALPDIAAGRIALPDIAAGRTEGENDESE